MADEHEHPAIIADIADAEERGRGLFVLNTRVLSSGRALIILNEVEPAHLERIFTADIAAAVEQSLFSHDAIQHIAAERRRADDEGE